MLKTGDLYVNVDVLDDCLILCRQCVLDLDTAVNAYLHQEDRQASA